MVMSIEIVR